MKCLHGLTRDKLVEICLKGGDIPTISDREYTFIESYCVVFSSIAIGLDKLQVIPFLFWI